MGRRVTSSSGVSRAFDSVVAQLGRASGARWTVFVAAIVLVVLGSVAANLALGSPPPGIDDAYITFVYGRHLQQGLGFVFIPGGERVEGMTSLAWALTSGAVLSLTDDPELPLLIVCGGCLVLTIVNVHRLLRVVAGDPRDAPQRLLLLLLLLGWTACQPGIFAWNVLTLMESSLWTFLVTYAAAALSVSATLGPGQLPVKSHLELSCCAAAMAVTRPESMALVPVMWALTLLLTLPSLGFGGAARRYLPSLAAFAVASIALVQFRLHYFGYPYPNTYYAKHTPYIGYSIGRGAKYAAKFLVTRPWNTAALAVLLATSVGSLIRLSKREESDSERALLLVAGTVVFCLAIPMLTGGDAFSEYRFYQPIVLLLIAPTAYWLVRRLPGDRLLQALRRGRTAVLSGLGAALLISSAWYAFTVSSYMEGEFTAATTGKRVGVMLTRMLEKADATLPTLGVVAAGGLGWAYGGPVLDLLGLNWTLMAHSTADRRWLRPGHGAFSEDVFWSQPPQLLVLDLQRLGSCGPSTPLSVVQTGAVREQLRGITETKRFSDQFEAGCLGEGSSSVAGFFSRSWLREHPSLAYHALSAP